MKKRITALILSSVIIANAFTAIAFASDDADIKKANILHKLGLVYGVSTTEFDPGFDIMLTREEAIALVVRFMGKEKAALYENRECRFQDVSPWAKPYVSYGYDAGITNGETEEWFGGGKYITMKQLCAFYLRAIGYNVIGNDYENVLKTALLNEMIDSEDDIIVTRRHMINVSYATLYANWYGSSNSVIGELVGADAINYLLLYNSGDDGLIAKYNNVSGKITSLDEVQGDIANSAKFNFGENTGQKLSVVDYSTSEALDYFNKKCRRINVGQSICLALDNTYMTAEDKYCTVLVTYFDGGADKIRISYSDRVLNYREGYIYKTNTNQWKTSAVVISDAAFAHRQDSGGDITIWAQDDDGRGRDEYISDIVLVKQTKEQQPIDASTIEPIKYDAFIDFKKGGSSSDITRRTNTNPNWYGYTEQTEQKGIGCISIGLDKRCVLDIDDDFITPEDPTCTFKLSYLDNGTDRFKFSYQTESKRYADVYINRTGTGEWKTTEIKATDASIINRQDEGVDISIYGVKAEESGGQEDNVYISRFEVCKPQ